MLTNVIWEFLLAKNTIGILVLADPVTGRDYSLRTNVADSEHKGLETYMEISPLKRAAGSSRHRVSLFNSLAYVDARYVSGEFSGKRVEYAPRLIERVGLTYGYGPVSVTGQYSYTGNPFGEANNVATPDNDNPLRGLVPAYSVYDLSATYRFQNVDLKAGIIPAIGRSGYVTLTIKI